MTRILGVVLAVALAGAAQQRQPERRVPEREKGLRMPEKIGIAAAELDGFEKNGGAAHLQKAVENLEEVDLFSVKQTGERLKARQQLLREWCRALAGVERVKDPKFDPDDAPLLNVMPPLQGGTEIPPKPMTPAARKEYEAAVAANEKKKADRRVQFLARELEDRIVESAQRLIGRWYTLSAADQKEIQAVFAETKLAPEQQKMLQGKRK